MIFPIQYFHIVIFSGSDLTHTDFSGSTNKIEERNKKIDFEDSHLFHSDFENSLFKEANFSWSFIWQCDFADSKLSRSNFSHAILKYVRVNDKTEIENALFEGTGILNCPLQLTKGFHVSMKNIIQSHRTVNYKKLIDLLLDNCSNVIRYAGIIDNTREIHSDRKNTKVPHLYLSGKDKSILVHYAWLSWRLRKDLEKIYGKIKFSIVEYEALKVITIPLNENEIMLITTFKDGNHIPLTNWILKHKIEFSNATVKTIDLEESNLSNSHYYDIPLDHDMLRNHLENVKYVDEVILHKKGTQFHTRDQIVEDVWKRWKYRLKFKNKIGEPLYALTVHDKKVTAACLIDNNETLVLLKLDPKIDQQTLSSLLLSIKGKCMGKIIE